MAQFNGIAHEKIDCEQNSPELLAADQKRASEFDIPSYSNIGFVRVAHRSLSLERSADVEN